MSTRIKPLYLATLFLSLLAACADDGAGSAGGGDVRPDPLANSSNQGAGVEGPAEGPDSGDGAGMSSEQGGAGEAGSTPGEGPAGIPVEGTPGDRWFTTGQAADRLLSAQGFDETGGALLFNHPKGIATDGTRLYLCDGNNNRVLVWETLPTRADDAPTLVLGQPDMHLNRSGRGPEQMNWPVGVSVGPGGAPVVVADSYNHRLLVWHAPPSDSGQPADLVIQGISPEATTSLAGPTDGNFVWPWGVWTDGVQLALTSTARGTRGGVGFGGWVLVWQDARALLQQTGTLRAPAPASGVTGAGSTWPAADLLLSADGQMGTPRTLTSDGDFLMVGDHNAATSGTVPGQGEAHGNWIWRSFPTGSEQAPDFFLHVAPGSIWLQGDFHQDGAMVAVGDSIYRWNSAPDGPDSGPDLSLRASANMSPSNMGYGLRSGDGNDVAIAGDRVFVSDYNGNRVLVFDSLPESESRPPDLVIGSPYSYDTASRIHTFSNSLDDNFFVTNPLVASDGQSILLASAFDGKLLGWDAIPVPGTTPPDQQYLENMRGVTSMALADGSLILLYNDHETSRRLRIWDSLADFRAGRPPATYGTLGSIQLSAPVGMAVDEQHLYICDRDPQGQDTLHVWARSGADFHASDPEPLYSIPLGDRGGSLSSDGQRLFMLGRALHWLDLSQLTLNPQPQPMEPGERWSRDVQSVHASHGHLFLSDRGYHRVLAWRDVQSALDGAAPDALLGATGPDDLDPGVSPSDLFWPDQLHFDGQRLWVGEYKFSGRVLGFSPGG